MIVESDPRWLGDTSTQAVDREVELGNEVAALRELRAMCVREGWHLLEKLLIAERVEGVAALTHRARDMAEVYAQRERLRLIDWLLELPNEVALKLTVAETELRGLSPREEEDEDA